MRKIVFLLMIFVGITSCKTGFFATTPTISLEKFKVDSISIRAITIINDSTVAFAGSNGKIGFVSEKGKIRFLPQVKHNGTASEFRSIAKTNNKLFVLNVGSPAQLYSIENEKLTLVYTEENEKVFYNSMHFFDLLNGIAMGDPTENCLSVLITTNGGTTWRKLSCNNLPPTFKGEAAFAASNTNISIYKNTAWLVSGGQVSRVFKTTDLGTTWQVFNTPIVQGKSTTGIYSVDFYNEKIGIICGGDYTDKYGKYANKAITKNGGKTWKLVGENEIPNYVSCVQYFPEGKGKKILAVSINGIFYSKNGGKKWILLSSEGFYAIHFASNNSAWLSGNNCIAKLNFK